MEKNFLLVVIVGVLMAFSMASANHVSTNLIPSDVQPSTDDGETQVEDENEKYNIEDLFVATDEWQEVRPGQVVPPGLHVRINLSTGKKEAKLLKENLKMNNQSESIKNISDDPKESTSSLRSFRDLEQIKREEALKLNTEFEVISDLMSHYDNSTPVQKLLILEDLEYYMHDFDNARDFVMTASGLEKIVKKSLEDRDPEIRSYGASILAASVQNHNVVKEKVLNDNIMEYLVKKLKDDENTSVRSKIIYSLNNLIQDHSRSWQEFQKNSGMAVFLNLLKENESRIKILRLLSEVFIAFESHKNDFKDVYGSQICSELINELQSRQNFQDIVYIFTLTDIINNLSSVCDQELTKNGNIPNILHKMSQYVDWWDKQEPSEDEPPIIRALEETRQRLYSRGKDEL